MTAIPKTEREEQRLPLSSTPVPSGIEVKNAEPLHPPASRSANARNSPRSHGSGESFISSGCHWTAITHQSSESDSTPSMIPSGDRAVMRKPSPSSRML